MKNTLLAALMLVSIQSELQSQSLKIVVKDEQGNLIPAVISGVASFPIAVNAEKQVIDLSQYGIRLNASLSLMAAPTREEDKRKYPVSSPKEVRVVSGEKTVTFQFKKPAANTDSYIRGIVKTEWSGERNFIAVIIKEKDGNRVLQTMADADGYFEIKIPLSKWLNNRLSAIHVKFSDSLGKMDELMVPVDLAKSQYDYWIDASMRKKNTKMTIEGRVQFPDGASGSPALKLISNGEEIPVTDLMMDSAGIFSFTLDTAIYNPLGDLEMIVRAKGMQENSTFFRPRSVQDFFLVNLELLPRGKHSVSVGLTWKPGDYFLAIAYYYHPVFGHDHLAFGAEAGYCDLMLTTDDLIFETTEIEMKQKERNICMGLAARYYYSSYTETKSFNPFATLSVNYSTAFGLIQPKLSAGLLFFPQTYIAISAEGSLACNIYTGGLSDFNYYGDAVPNDKSITRFPKGYASIRVHYYFPQK